MKKTYIIPSVKETIINVEGMICLSTDETPASTDGQEGGGDGLAKDEMDFGW